MYSISIFYFTFYFFGGAYAPDAPPLPYTGLLLNILHAIMSALNMSTLIRRIQKLLHSCHHLTFSLSKTVWIKNNNFVLFIISAFYLFIFSLAWFWHQYSAIQRLKLGLLPRNLSKQQYSHSEFMTADSVRVCIHYVWRSAEMRPTVILIIIGIPSPTHSFIPVLKPSFSANPFPPQPFLFFSRIHYMDSPWVYWISRAEQNGRTLLIGCIFCQ